MSPVILFRRAIFSNSSSVAAALSSLHVCQTVFSVMNEVSGKHSESHPHPFPVTLSPFLFCPQLASMPF